MYLAIDYGRKRIGLAIGSVFPHGAGVLDGGKKREEIIAEIVKLVQNNEVTGVVVGWPVRSQGEPGTLAPEIREFAQAVADATDLSVYLESEQFTSTEAAAYLEEIGGKHDKGKVDEVAAILILEQFLSRQKEGEIEADIKPRQS